MMFSIGAAFDDSGGTAGGKKHKHSKIHDEPPGRSFINTKAEILDFEVPECNLLVATEVKNGKLYQVKLEAYRFFAFIAVGVIVGLVAFLILLVHEELAVMKNKLLISVIQKHHIVSPLSIIVWFGGVLIPAMIGSLLVVFIEPKAAGGGVAGIVGYVNGVDTSATLTMKIMLIKSLSVICCITAGLAGGMEGPLVHIGSILAACLPDLRLLQREPLRYLRTDYERRDLVGGGIASGISAAFFAPIGGFVMAMEEGMIYWNLKIIFYILVCSMVTDIIITSLMSVLFGCSGCLSAKTFLFFSIINEIEFSHQLHYLFLYFIEAAIAGLLGAAWNAIQTRLILLRKKYIKLKWHQLLEMFTISLITAICGWIMLFALRRNCVHEPHHSEGFHFGALQMECKKGEITAIGTLLTHTQSNAIRFLFNDSDEFDLPTLAIFSITYFFLSVFTMGTFISAGIFIPNLFLGSVWGRLYGEVLKKTFFSRDTNFRPSVFAIVGASCQLCGVIRIPYTLGVIMMESSGTTQYIIPVFLSQIITTIVGNIFNHSIYHTQCFLAGMPIAETEPPPFCMDIEVQTLMNPAVKTIKKKEKIHYIIDLLKGTKHNIFPIVKNKGGISSISSDRAHSSTTPHSSASSSYCDTLEGTILRYQLIKILKYKLHEKTNLRQVHWLYIFQDYPSFSAADILKDDFSSNAELDLGLYMNRSPLVLLSTSSYNNAYNMITFLGARHIMVVNKRNELLGILTRKDVLIYREHSSVFGVHVVKLPKV